MKTTAGGRNSQHSFAKIPTADIPRSSFNRSSNLKTTFDAGFLIPIFVDEALPGDTMNMRATLFARMATPIWPVLDNIMLETHFFAVPLRLLWSNFKKFMGEQANPADSTDFLIPILTSPAGGFARLGMMDYMGIPPKAGAGTTSVSAMWARAYNLIWNEWYRDENLQNSVTVPLTDGPDAETTYPILRRGKRKDYFTSALPWPQKGTAVTLPLGSTAPIVYTSGTTPGFLRKASDRTIITSGASNLQRIGTTGEFSDAAGPTHLIYDPAGTLVADLAGATASTINAIRTAFQIQKLYERDARGGTRYTELVRSHFGVTSPDARLQRPEYLGGGSINISVNPVPVTADDSGTNIIGALGAFAVAAGSGAGFVKSFTEHCVIIGLAAVRADLNYQQGIPRMFSRRTKVDFYWPALAHLGEQSILSKEIYHDTTAGDADVFGYQERWAEYRYKPSVITGKLRSSDPTSLHAWHLAQTFAARPVLNTTFIQDTPPFARVVAVPSEPHFIMDGYFQLTHVRPMPTYGVPGLVDHF